MTLVDFDMLSSRSGRDYFEFFYNIIFYSTFILLLALSRNDSMDVVIFSLGCIKNCLQEST